jgi:hypothetical protein
MKRLSEDKQEKEEEEDDLAAAHRSRLLSEEDREDIKAQLRTIIDYINQNEANIEGLLTAVVRIYSAAYGRGFIAGRRYGDIDFLQK